MVNPYFNAYVVAEQFFEKEFSSDYKHLDDFRGFLAKKSFIDKDYYVVCTFDSPRGSINMIVVSDCSKDVEQGALYELMIQMNDCETRASIKLNPSGVWYSHFSQNFMYCQITETLMSLMLTECLNVIWLFENRLEKALEGDAVPSKAGNRNSAFPYCPSDLQDYLGGTIPDPWSAAAPPMSPALKRRMRFLHIIEYDRATMEREKLDENQLGTKAPKNDE